MNAAIIAGSLDVIGKIAAPIVREACKQPALVKTMVVTGCGTVVAGVAAGCAWLGAHLWRTRNPPQLT